MARSQRSKKDQTNKRIKRATFFGDVADERALRLAEKLHGASSEQLTALRKKVERARGNEVMDDDEDSAEAAKPAEQNTKKVSTAGWSSKKKHLSKRPHARKKGAHKK